MTTPKIDLHKIKAWTSVGGWGMVLSVLLYVIANFGDVATGMHTMNRFIEILPHLDSLIIQAPSMNRLIKDYEIIHSTISDRDELQKTVDSLEIVVDILTYGKAPYQDTVWYMSEYGIWVKCNIRNHPLLNE